MDQLPPELATAQPAPEAEAPPAQPAAAEPPAAERLTLAAFLDTLPQHERARLVLHLPKDHPTDLEGWTAALERALRERI